MAIIQNGQFPTEAQLERVVPAFYARVRSDPLLAPVFNSAVDDWDHHLGRLIAFWSSVILSSGKYKGNPVAMHGALGSKITPEMFDRWLQLWDETTDALLPPAHAVLMQQKARLIAESLKLSLWFRLPEPGNRAR